MPVAQHWHPHFLLTWGGTFFGTETWQMGLRLSRTTVAGAPWVDNPAPWAGQKVAAYKDKIVTWWGKANLGASREAYLEWVKFNAIKSDGKIDGNTVHQSAVNPSIRPAAFAPLGEPQPPQVALVLSMRTELRGPRSSHGHIYLPAARYTMVSGSSPYIDPAQTALILTCFKDFLGDVNNTPGIEFGQGPKVSIQSKRSTLKDGTVQDEGEADVISCRVGNLYDTHRSRRGQLRETYQAATL